MIQLLLYLLGAFIAVIFPKQIMLLGYITMKTELTDDGKLFFYNAGDNDFPNWFYVLATFFLSWLSIILIYVTTIFYISINKKLR
jgi:hypothetical protein